VIRKDGVENVAAIAKVAAKDKALAYTERLSMLNYAAVEVNSSTTCDMDGKRREVTSYDLHYRVYSHPVCRMAYMYFHSIPESTLRDAEKNFCEGKGEWGHSSRRSRKTGLSESIKCDAQRRIEHRSGNAHEIFY